MITTGQQMYLEVMSPWGFTPSADSAERRSLGP